jgi:serine protease Do
LLRWLFAICLLVLVPWATARLEAQDSTAESGQESPSIRTGRPLPDELRARAPQDLEELRLLEQHVQVLLDKIRPATVSLSGGSGVVVSADGYILTCAHVNQRAGRTVTVTFPDGTRCKAVTMGDNHGIDAGLVKISDPGEYPFAPLGNSAAVQPGEWCLAVGYPVSFQRGMQPAVRLGRVHSNKQRMIVSDCPIMGGDSGGPLFDLNGHVIGINSRVNNSVDTNIHVPVDTFREHWDRLVAQEDWSDQRPSVYMGITRDPETDGVRIAEVKPESPAQKAGFEIGDFVTEVNERPVASIDVLRLELGRYKPQDTVRVKVDRNGQSIVLEVTLAPWPKT